MDVVFRQAYSRIDNDLKEKIAEFVENNPWLEDYVLYKTIKSKFNTPWYEWPEEFRDRDERILGAIKKLLAEEINYYAFLQYLFFTQWKENKDYINAQGVEIIGDIPMYVSDDSSDVWANRDVFEMDGENFTNVAGVPPDFFCEDGQLWGNPLYNWERMREDGYKWWIERLGHSLSLYDLLRFDHFRALASYYAIPASEDTARNGTWRVGPGMDFFNKVLAHYDRNSFIAEDLGGEGAPEVQGLLHEAGLPGMRLVEMAFTPYGINEMHMPSNYNSNHIAYLGTHDNNTLLGWLKNDIQDDQRANALRQMGYENPETIDLEALGINNDVVRSFVEGLWNTDARLSIIQLQDALGLDQETRMNTPGTTENNWVFKIPGKTLEEFDRQWLKDLNQKYNRENN